MKGQYWSIDMVFAMIVFTSAIIILTNTWSRVNNDFAVTYGYGIGNMQAQLNGLQQRIFSPGIPSDWDGTINLDNPSTWVNTSIGLTQGNTTIISDDKLLTLAGMANSNNAHYEATKQSLGIGYDYYITFYSPNNYNITLGRNPLMYNATAIQTATLPVVLSNGAAGTMHLYVWTNTSFGVS